MLPCRTDYEVEYDSCHHCRTDCEVEYDRRNPCRTDCEILDRDSDQKERVTKEAGRIVSATNSVEARPWWRLPFRQNFFMLIRVQVCWKTFFLFLPRFFRTFQFLSVGLHLLGCFVSFMFEHFSLLVYFMLLSVSTEVETAYCPPFAGVPLIVGFIQNFSVVVPYCNGM